MDEEQTPDKAIDGVTIRDVEVFRVGRWNGDSYSAKDLDAMVEAFGEVGYKPPVKIGHKTQDNEPAFGWVENLRRQGEVLLADFANVPHDLSEMIKAKRFGSVSAEIFFNLSRNGKRFARALKAVSILGSEVPGVSNLKPLFEATFGEHTFGKLVHASEFQPTEKKVAPMNTIEEIKAALDVAITEGNGEEIKTLSQSLADMTAAEAVANADNGDDDAEILELHSLREEVKALKASTEAATESARQAALDNKVSGIIPSLRPYVRAFYDLATREEGRVATFSFDGKDKELNAEQLVDEFVKQSSKITKLLSIDMAEAGEGSKKEISAAVEVDEAVKAFRATAEGKAMSYTEAQAAVLAKNETLKSRYALEVN